MIIHCFAGPNGSGKSTIVDKFIKNNNLSNMPFVNADIIAKTQFAEIKDPYEQNLLAAQFAEIKRNEYIDKKQDFIFETVLSTPRNLELLKKAKSEGADINLVYVLTRDSEINIERVAQRVLEGGHDVPKEKIISRYNRCLNLLPEVLSVCDTGLIYDTSNNNETNLIIRKTKSNKLIVYHNKNDEFVEKLIQPILNLNNYEVIYDDNLSKYLNEDCMYDLKKLENLETDILIEKPSLPMNAINEEKSQEALDIELNTTNKKTP